MSSELRLVLTDERLIEIAIEAESSAEEARETAARAYAELTERGWSQSAIARAVGKSQPHIGYAISALERKNDNPGYSYQEAYSEAQGKESNVHFSSETPEWSTPQDLFDLLDREFGFTVDVCATPENAKCAAFYSEGALEETWRGVCWMNPPYGREIPKWVEKAWQSSFDGATVVCLVPARTDTDWWWDYCTRGEIRFVRGRLRFGDVESSAPFPSAVVIFGAVPCVKWWDAWPLS